MKVQIVGAGAIGCLVASWLCEVEAVSVALVGRERFSEAMNSQGGLHVSVASASSARPKTIANLDARASIAPDCDLVVLAVKSYDTETTAEQVAASCGTKVPIVSLQNGVGNEELLSDAGFDRVIAGSLTTPVSVLGPAHIRIDRPSAALGLAPWSDPEGQELGNTMHRARPSSFEAITRLFDESSFDVSIYDSAANLKWTKLLMNISANATSAILNRTPAQVFADSRLVDLEIEAWRETLAVIGASDCSPIKLGSYPFNLLAPLIRKLPKSVLRPAMRRQVVGARGAKMPSLHIDVQRSRGRTEVDWLNGAVLEHGRQLGVSTPVNAALVKLVHAVAGGEPSFDAEELLAAVRSAATVEI